MHVRLKVFAHLLAPGVLRKARQVVRIGRGTLRLRRHRRRRHCSDLHTWNDAACDRMICDRASDQCSK